MCGISGIFSKKPIDRIRERIENMNKSLHHRGPDAGGIFLQGQTLALGHRRLSIIDIGEHANQPMQSNSGRWHIVFNGEIYNFEKIKQKLKYEFRTHSDTEVIVASLDIYGLDWFLNEANGMFSIGIYDNYEEELIIVRDRMGIKPLYYYEENGAFIFSSEIKGILSSGLVQADFNELAVDEYLANRYVRAPYTCFRNIYQVESGTFIRINSKHQKRIEKYWELPNYFNKETSFDEAVILKRFEEQFIEAVELRLIADVPLGTYLSGGIDSSLITAVTALSKGAGVNTYTIGFSEMNEFNYSQRVADLYKTEHHEILLDRNDYVKNWERLIKFKDAPLGVPNEIPLALMSERLKEKITVVLSGEGADELLGGYGRIFRSAFDFFYNKDNSMEFYDYLIDRYEYVPRTMRDTMLATPNYYRDFFDEKIKHEFRNRNNEENIFRFFHNYHVKGLLQRVDMTTMQTSVEARVPFLDHKLIEFAYEQIPYELKLKWKDNRFIEKAKKTTSDKYSEDLDIPKFILRQLGYKYLPSEIIERKKVGFPVPLTAWFHNLEVLAKDILTKTSWLRAGAVEELITMSKKQERAGQILWMFLNIELFRKNYFYKDWTW